LGVWRDGVWHGTDDPSTGGQGGLYEYAGGHTDIWIDGVFHETIRNHAADDLSRITERLEQSIGRIINATPKERVNRPMPRVARELNEVLRPHNFQPTVEDLIWVIMFDASLRSSPAFERIERTKALIRALLWLMSNPNRREDGYEETMREAKDMQFDVPYGEGTQQHPWRSRGNPIPHEGATLEEAMSDLQMRNSFVDLSAEPRTEDGFDWGTEEEWTYGRSIENPTDSDSGAEEISTSPNFEPTMSTHLSTASMTHISTPPTPREQDDEDRPSLVSLSSDDSDGG
jgi:hypothetical protein